VTLSAGLLYELQIGQRGLDGWERQLWPISKQPSSDDEAIAKAKAVAWEKSHFLAEVVLRKDGREISRGQPQAPAKG
jgi:hypothetical protein